MTALDALLALCFGYPFVMSWYWIVGGLLPEQLRDRFEPPPDAPPPLDTYPLVSILIPCFNEEDGAEETFAALDAIDYPDYEVIAINDGSRDRTAQVLEGIARGCRSRVVNSPRTREVDGAQRGACRSRRSWSSSTVTPSRPPRAHVDGAALQSMRTCALTGNPRIRNRASLLRRLQVGEFWRSWDW
jgi:biofilm PGA synthesis N-glycosyltransferase PgaC